MRSTTTTIDITDHENENDDNDSLKRDRGYDTDSGSESDSKRNRNSKDETSDEERAELLLEAFEKFSNVEYTKEQYHKAMGRILKDYTPPPSAFCRGGI